MASLNSSVAQKSPLKATERIQSLKKIKLLEILELNETDGDKFLVKYNELEKNVLDKFKKFEDANDALQKAIRDDDYKNIDKLNDNFLTAHRELHQAMQEKFEGVRKILPKEKFAKYLLFERRFQHELRKQIFKRMGDKDPDDDDFIPGSGPKHRDKRR